MLIKFLEENNSNCMLNFCVSYLSVFTCMTFAYFYNFSTVCSVYLLLKIFKKILFVLMKVMLCIDEYLTQNLGLFSLKPQ